MMSGFVENAFSDHKTPKKTKPRRCAEMMRFPFRRLRHIPLPRSVSPDLRSFTSTTSAAMKFNTLGTSGLSVSDVCLGTMTWGLQNTEAEAHEQLDYALAKGVNFLDTAELYPVPSSAPKWVPGKSEEYIGTYLATRPGLREKIVIATKCMGFAPKSIVVENRKEGAELDKKDGMPSRLDKKSIREACEASLRRMQTDYIDLYQLHWPDRYVPLFGTRSYNPDQERPGSVPIRETLEGLKELLDEGKIKAYGLSNETTFGVCEFVRLADELGMPRPATIQNAFCLLNRSFEAELAEACSPSNFNIGLLPWSVLAGGVLTGKYNGKLDDNFEPVDNSLERARFVLFKSFQGHFVSKQTLGVTEQYMQIAKSKGMSVATLAQAFCKTRWYIPSTIIGATTIAQLKENIEAFDVELDKESLDAIDQVHRACKDPCLDL